MTINTFQKQKRLNVNLTDRVGRRHFQCIKIIHVHTPLFQLNGLISGNHKFKLDLFSSKTNAWILNTTSPSFSSFSSIHLPMCLLSFKTILCYLIFTVV